MINSLDANQLIRNCRVGDPFAIETFVRTHQEAVYRLALSVLGDPAEAEEAAQDALLQALRALEQFRGDAALRTWLYRITLNTCRNRQRRQQARARLQTTLERLTLTQHTPSPEGHAQARETQNAVWQAVQALEEKHRYPVILRYYHDFSVAEIAQLLDVNEGTIHSRLSIARDRLRLRLRDQAGSVSQMEDLA